METWRRERARPAGVKVRAAAAAASMGLSEEMTLGLNEGARDDAGEGNDPGEKEEQKNPRVSKIGRASCRERVSSPV